MFLTTGDGDKEAIRAQIMEAVKARYSKSKGEDALTPAELKSKLATMSMAARVRSGFLGRTGYGFSEGDYEIGHIDEDYRDQKLFLDVGPVQVGNRWKQITLVQYPDGTQNLLTRMTKSKNPYRESPTKWRIYLSIPLINNQAKFRLRHEL